MDKVKTFKLAKSASEATKEAKRIKGRVIGKITRLDDVYYYQIRSN